MYLLDIKYCVNITSVLIYLPEVYVILNYDNIFSLAKTILEVLICEGIQN